MNFLDKPLVLRLNRNWEPIGVSTIKDALIAMNSGDDFLKAAVGMDMQYHQNEDGTWDFEQCNPVPTAFDKWMHLPIREFDHVIRTSKLVIRIPTVIIAQNYADMPKRHKRPTKENIRERDGSRCQITGRFLSKKEGNVDHNIPKSRGGKDTWKNLVWMDKKLNSIKGDKTLAEMGWKLLREPFEPKAMPASATIKELKHQDWKFFLHDYQRNI